MNRKQFDRALEGISDDFIDAAAGVYERRVNKKRIILGVVAAGLGLALMLAMFSAFWKAPGTDPTPTISLENPTTVPATQPTETEPTQPETTAPKQEEVIVTTDNVYFLSATEEGAALEPVQGNMTFPIAHMFRIVDLREMTAEEKYKAKMEAVELEDEFRKQYGKLRGEGHYGTYSSEKVIIQQFSAGFASVVILDNSQVDSVEKETTGVFDLGDSRAIHYEDVTLGQGEHAVTLPAGSKRLFLTLSMSLETQETYVTDPSTPLSNLSDTITVTIHYKNGTKEIVMIDITVDDNGQVYMTQRGNNTGV